MPKLHIYKLVLSAWLAKSTGQSTSGSTEAGEQKRQHLNAVDDEHLSRAQFGHCLIADFLHAPRQLWSGLLLLTLQWIGPESVLTRGSLLD